MLALCWTSVRINTKSVDFLDILDYLLCNLYPEVF